MFKVCTFTKINLLNNIVCGIIVFIVFIINLLNNVTRLDGLALTL
jgi:hypothetical protein